jgi:DUF4097 and DUF4098 domain-containing protein YvlB
VVLAPQVSALYLETSNGSVEASGFSGNARLKISNGLVTLEDHGGPVSTSTSNGSVSVSGSLRKAGIKMSTGKIVASGLSGEVDSVLESAVVSRTKKRAATLRSGGKGMQSKARTSNGSIRVERD